VEEVGTLHDLGIKRSSVRLPANKDANRLQRPGRTTARAASAAGPADTFKIDSADHGRCFCEYTVMATARARRIRPAPGRKNDKTLPCWPSMCSATQGGCDVVAPSGLMDGMVGAIRKGLMKRASAAADHELRSEVRFGVLRSVPRRADRRRIRDRSGYQWTPPTATKRLREVRLDLQRAPTCQWSRPAMAYMDIISASRTVSACGGGVQRSRRAPWSGGGADGWIDERPWRSQF